MCSPDNNKLTLPPGGKRELHGCSVFLNLFIWFIWFFGFFI